jgi:hypothetical protein
MNTNYHARKSLSRDCYPLRSWALAIPFCPSFLSKPSFLTSFWKQSQIGKVQVAWQIRSLREWLNVTATFCPWSHYRTIKDRKCYFIKLQSMSHSICPWSWPSTPATYCISIGLNYITKISYKKERPFQLYIVCHGLCSRSSCMRCILVVLPR